MRTKIPALIAIWALYTSILSAQTPAPSPKPLSNESAEVASSLSKSAEGGNAAAQAKLGLAFMVGSDEPKDYAKALFWLNKAARQGDSSAEANLGYLFLNGWGVVQDYAQARLWISKSAAQDNALGENNLGAMYEYGWGVARNDVEAVMWYRKAAEQGLAEAQDNLGHMYRNGIGLMEDDAKAVEWYRKAADQGFAQAENDLGAMYANGLGVSQDNAKAVEWLRKAAEQGDSDAEKNLDMLQPLIETVKEIQSLTGSIESLTAARSVPAVPASSGRIKGTLTYYFNDNYGNKPDTGSLVLLLANTVQIPAQDMFIDDASQTKFGGSNDEIAIIAAQTGVVTKYKTVQRTVADGNGNFEIDNIPNGEYTLILRSAHVKTIAIRDGLGRVVSLPLEISNGQALDRSYDFGITAF